MMLERNLPDPGDDKRLKDAETKDAETPPRQAAGYRAGPPSYGEYDIYHDNVCAINGSLCEAEGSLGTERETSGSAKI